MENGFYIDLKKYLEDSVERLRFEAKQSGIFDNSSDLGSEREEIYQSFLKKHLPKQCDIHTGGYLFNLEGKKSKQIDIIVTSGNTPKFQINNNKKSICPIEGTVGVFEIKSTLNKELVVKALKNIGSIPDITTHISPSPFLNRGGGKQLLHDFPYKVIFSFDSALEAETLTKHVNDFYAENHNEIPMEKRPNMIHVLGKYVLVRRDRVLTAVDKNTGEEKEIPSHPFEYRWFDTGVDLHAILAIIVDLQQYSFYMNHVIVKYDRLIDRVLDKIQDD